MDDFFLRNINLVFWNGFSVQDRLYAMLEKCKQAVENSQVFGTLLTDLF